MIKGFKPDLTDKKSKVLFGTKIVVALVYTYFLISFFVNKYFIVWTVVDNKEVTEFEIGRIIIVVLLYIIGLFFLFVNIELTNKQNTIATIVLAILSVIIVFYNTF